MIDFRGRPAAAGPSWHEGTLHWIRVMSKWLHGVPTLLALRSFRSVSSRLSLLLYFASTHSEFNPTMDGVVEPVIHATHDRRRRRRRWLISRITETNHLSSLHCLFQETLEWLSHHVTFHEGTRISKPHFGVTSVGGPWNHAFMCVWDRENERWDDHAWSRQKSCSLLCAPVCCLLKINPKFRGSILYSDPLALLGKGRGMHCALHQIHIFGALCRSPFWILTWPKALLFLLQLMHLNILLECSSVLFFSNDY
jgi:hypothetical protein